jgi:hypothetical protein
LRLLFKDPNHITLREADMSFEKLWGIVRVAPLAALALILFSAEAQAQRQCSGRQGGFSNRLQTQPMSYSYLQSQINPSLLQQQQTYLQQQQMLMQAQLNAMQANALQANAMQANAFQANGVQANAAQLNALRQYVLDQQMLGVDPQDALQSGWYALQRTQARQAARNQR